MLRIAHLSDPHLGPLPRVRVHELFSKRAIGYANWHRGRHAMHRPEVVAALVAELRRLDPDHIAVTGDLVNIALDEEFATASEWLHALGAPDEISVVPGNHDAYVSVPVKRGFGRWAAYMTSDGAEPEERPRFPYLRRRGDVSLIGVSSGEPSLPFMATGRVRSSQRAALRDLLQAEARLGQFRVVLIHHPPHPGGAARHKRLIHSRRFCEVLAEAGAELVLHGHNHRTSLAWLESDGAPIPILGVSSASVMPDETGRREAAALHLFKIAKANRGFDVTLSRYRFDNDLAQVVPAESAVRLAPGLELLGKPSVFITRAMLSRTEEDEADSQPADRSGEAPEQDEVGEPRTTPPA